jgi:hypothetical protein
MELLPFRNVLQSDLSMGDASLDDLLVLVSTG